MKNKKYYLDNKQKNYNNNHKNTLMNQINNPITRLGKGFMYNVKGDRVVLARTSRVIKMKNARGETITIHEGQSYINGIGSKDDNLRIGGDYKRK